jgi:hypothetical protein
MTLSNALAEAPLTINPAVEPVSLTPQAVLSRSLPFSWTQAAKVLQAHAISIPSTDLSFILDGNVT